MPTSSPLQADATAAMAAARSASMLAMEALIQEAEGARALLQERVGRMERERAEAVAGMRSWQQAADCLQGLGGPEGLVCMQQELEEAGCTAAALECKLQAAEAARCALR